MTSEEKFQNCDQMQQSPLLHRKIVHECGGGGGQGFVTTIYKSKYWTMEELEGMGKQ